MFPNSSSFFSCNAFLYLTQFCRLVSLSVGVLPKYDYCKSETSLFGYKKLKSFNDALLSYLNCRGTPDLI